MSGSVIHCSSHYCSISIFSHPSLPSGPNRQYEAAFRIIQSGEWGEYDGFYLMEGDSVPIKAHWLDVVLSEIEKNRPFAVLGA